MPQHKDTNQKFSWCNQKTQVYSELPNRDVQCYSQRGKPYRRQSKTSYPFELDFLTLPDRQTC